MKKDIEAEFTKFEELINEIDITQKAKRGLLKQLGVIHKCVRPKAQNKTRSVNQNSGLQKPVIISEEMAKFAEWNPSDLHSRVEVTKVICAYIKSNSLQKPENRRIILVDDKLKKLLNYDEDEITYPHIQKYIGAHLSKPPAEEKEKASPVEKKVKTPKVKKEKAQKTNNK